MPELPEVETVRTTLHPLLIGARVNSVDIRRPDVISGPATPESLLVGQTIINTVRVGKQLAVVGSSGSILVVQLGMSGHFYIPASIADLALPHVHVSWTLRGKDRKVHPLLFRDPRRFGELTPLADATALEARWKSLGPDALHITGGELHDALRDSDRPIKAALLDQSVVAGVGNIYADESLHRSGIKPSRRCNRIKPAQYVVLADAIHTILAQAISRHGSSIRDYRDGSGQPGSNQEHLKVYGRAGCPCLNCGTRLRSRQLAQRTTVWCDRCQS